MGKGRGGFVRRVFGAIAAAVGLAAATTNPGVAAAQNAPPITQSPMRREERKQAIPVTASLPRSLVNAFKQDRREPIWTGFLRAGRMAGSVKNWGQRR